MREEELLSSLEKKIKDIKNLVDLNNLKAEFLGKKGSINELTKKIGTMLESEKKEFGKKLNEIKTKANSLIEEKKNELEKKILEEKLNHEKIDISLPSTKIKLGSPHMEEKIIEQVEEFFIRMGYDVIDGPEIELDKYNFEMLNLPKEHPARDAQDTFYLKDDTILLRSQTSPVQVRTMLEGKGEKPIRMICPGKAYRREDINPTHEQELCQIEGLVIDKNISLSDLKGTVDAFVKHLFGPNVEIRFRPSYYPFTEPSVEIDMSCIYCDGEGCNMCKPKGWITICGAGMVHPNVLKMCGYNPDEWQGFAFGFGAERLTMLKYNMNDMRILHENDLRESINFDRRDGV